MPTPVRSQQPGRLRLDALEARDLPSAGLDLVYQHTGQFNRVNETVKVAVAIPVADITLPVKKKTVMLGFAFEPAASSTLDPHAISGRGSGGSSISAVRRVSNLPNAKTSLLIGNVKPGGTINLTMKALRSTGAFEVSTFLVGDVDGDGRVTTIDTTTIQSLNGAKRTESRYILEADANRDGVINRTDLVYANRNLDIVLNANRGERRIRESTGLISEVNVPIALGTGTGSRVLRFPVQTFFNTTDTTSRHEDTFLAYLVDPNNPTQTLVDRGTPGTAFFSLSGSTAEMIPGRVRYDGTTVELDVSDLTITNALLRFQLLNTDTDTGGNVHAGKTELITDPNGLPRPTMDNASELALLGSATNTSVLNNSSNLAVRFRNLRVDAAGTTTAEVVVRNNGAALGRQIAIIFAGLPTGVTLAQASGVDGSNQPYVNLRDAIPSGGLGTGQETKPVQVSFVNPNRVLLHLTPLLKDGGPNQAPVLDAIGGPFTITVGERFTLDLTATDPDGDMVNLFVDGESLPTGNLTDSTLVLMPTPTDIGTYHFDVLASDGVAVARRAVEVNVVADPITTTRLSGVLHDSEGLPLADVQVSLGGYAATTQADGSFTITFPAEFPAGTFTIFGQDIVGPTVYPTLTLDIETLLARSGINNFNNVIPEPLILASIDTANSVVLDEFVSYTLTSPVLEDTYLTFEEGTVFEPLTIAFTGLERDDLPSGTLTNDYPEIIFRVDALGVGDYYFGQAATIQTPNVAQWDEGTLLDLWHLDPFTGQFTDVGNLQVQGTELVTVSGGVSGTGLYYVAAQPVLPADPMSLVQNEDTGGLEDAATAPLTSVVELHSGAVIESHDLVTYQSVGQTRGLSLRYDSNRADRRPIINFALPNVPATTNTANKRLVARLEVFRGSFSMILPGAERFANLDYGYHYWAVPSEGGRFEAALQVDLSHLPSGQYSYQVLTAYVTLDETLAVIHGRGTPVTGTFNLVHSPNPELGEGWGLAGVEKLIKNGNGDILIVDGDGSERFYRLPATEGTPFISSAGDESVLEYVEEGLDAYYRRTTPDRTVYIYNPQGLLTSVTDRNNNRTRYTYEYQFPPAIPSRLASVIDPVGLTTTFTYDAAGVTITDPVQRVTRLDITNKRLTKITDPDGSRRTFGYDTAGRMTSEIDKRGFREDTHYGFHGRATGGRRADGTFVSVNPVQTQALLQPDATRSRQHPPPAKAASAVGQVADPAGGVTSTEVDRRGQTVAEKDPMGIKFEQIERDDDNRITRVTTAENDIYITYNAAGKPIAIRDALANAGGGESYLFATTLISTIDDMTVADFNGDGLADMALGTSDALFIYTSNGDGTFDTTDAFPGQYRDVATGDIDNDGDTDIVTFAQNTTLGRSQLTVFANTAGRFNIVRTQLGDSVAAYHVRVGDFNNDGAADIVYTQPTGYVAMVNDGTGVFATPISTGISGVYPFDLGYINPDDRIDLVLSSYDQFLSYWGIGDGTFQFAQATNRMGYHYQSWLRLQDLNGDTLPDILGTTFKYFPGQGTKSQLYTSMHIGSSTYGPDVNQSDLGTVSVGRMVAGDITGDTFADLLYMDNDGGEIFIKHGDGVGGFVDAESIPPTPANLIYYNAELGDIDGDGDLDFLTLTYDVNTDRRYFTARLNDGEITPSEPKERTAEYDSTYQQLVQIKDELGRRSFYDIDPVNGNRLQEILVIGEVGGDDDIIRDFTYNERGQLLTSFDTCGCTGFVVNEYDALGRLIKVTYGQGTDDEAFIEYEYDTAGNRTAYIDEHGNRTEYAYDLMNRLLTETRADLDGNGPLVSPVTSYAYDSVGNRTTVTAPLGQVWISEYDPRNRLAVTTTPDPDGTGPLTASTERMAYDDSGNLIAETDALGRITKHTYDGRNRKTTTIDPAGGLTKFEYDQADNLTAIVDPNNQRTTMAYDVRNRLIKETDANGKSTTHRYNEADERIETKDRNGRRTTFEYDDVGRLVKETWYNANDSVANVIETTYDKRNNRLSVTDNFSSLTFTYDARNRMTSSDNAGTPNAPHVVLAYEYDNASNVIAVTETLDGEVGATTNYVYDALDRLTHLSQSGANTAEKSVRFQYNNLDQRVRLDRFADLNGTKPVVGTDYQYDNAHRLTHVSHLKGTKAVASHVLAYDVANQITKRTMKETSSYTYDLTGQLLTSSYRNQRFSYDLNGNRTMAGYTHDEANRVVADGSYTYTYDDEGNIIQRRTRTGVVREFVWDHRNRLIQVLDKDRLGRLTQTVTYAYDADDRRILKVVDKKTTDTVPGEATHMVYDREDMILEYTDPDGLGVGNPAQLSRRFLHGPGIDDVLAQEQLNEPLTSPTRVLWLLADPLGSIRDIVDQTGVVRNHIVYDAFGRIVSQSNSRLGSPYLFTSREYDPETSLYYYRSRYYDPALGRFMSEDRIRFDAGDMNLYRYVGNDPIRYIDPTGKNSLFYFIFYVMGEGIEECREYYNRAAYDKGDGTYAEGNAVTAASEHCVTDWLVLVGLMLLGYARWQQERKRRKKQPNERALNESTSLVLEPT